MNHPTSFIDVERGFHDLTEEELEDTESLLAWSEYDFGPAVGWSDLLEDDRVVLLAEAGAGKTKEMTEQAKRLVGEGRFAFFAPLESLDREPIVDLLSVADAKRFEEWKADGRETAWFFLDAVDELKLTEGKLDRALRELAKVIDGHTRRARVIISCRPSDWRPHLDLTTVRDRLPVPARLRETAFRSPEEVFLEALRRGGHETAGAHREEEAPTHQGTVRTVAMLPMSDQQIRLFVERSGLHDSTAFLSEVTERRAWAFARRPLDLAGLIEIWRSEGRLGTRAQQHEANVTAKLGDNPDRPDRDVLSDDRARLGAERLALALAVTRTRTIRSPEQALDIGRTDGVLDAAKILPDWTEAERQALLRRALLDPATYGRVRFHHRSVQEYLAARRLRALREGGMSVKALLRLLFAERYGVEVVLPSMRAIAAWLALWDDAARKELTNREPEALLSLGDPETLDLAARGNLMRAFVSAYGQGGWRGLNIPLDEVRRLAHPELAPVIRECWGSGPANEDVRELLIEMIWQGRIEACADLARSVAFDTTLHPAHRVIAVRALVACVGNDSVREIADPILAYPDSWPAEVVHGIAADLFPRIITAGELVTLMERTPEPRQTVGGFAWVTKRIVETIEPWSESAVALRDEMAALVRRGRSKTSDAYHVHGKFNYLALALAMLCERQLCDAADASGPDLIHTCVIASRFGGRELSGPEPIGKLRARFAANAERRRDAFWAELAFMDEVVPADHDRWRFHDSLHESLVGSLTETDRPWLDAALADESRPERRAVALHALIDGWYRRGQVASELDGIRARLKDDPSLGRILEEHTRPRERSEELERMERDRRCRQRVRERKEEDRLASWRKWRDELLADPSDAFSAENLDRTIDNLYSWLLAANQDRSYRNPWDKGALIRAFGPDVAERTESALRARWRTTSPVLWSDRPAAERSTIRGDWILGLSVISAEASTPGWTDSLSPDEARVAVAYATVELDGFAPFIADLAKSHPAEVSELIGGEVSAELRVGDDHDHLPVLQHLTHAESGLKQLLLPRLLDELKAWPSVFSDETGSRWVHHLDQVLRILDETRGETDRGAIATECANRYEADPVGALALVWLRGLFRFDVVRGTRALVTEFADRKDPAAHARAIDAFAALFGEHDSPVPAFECIGPAQRGHILGQLVRYAHAFVRPEDDQIHEKFYTPDARDKAEDARRFLLSKLLDTPGPEAHRAILDLADEDDFAHAGDHLRLMARQRAATDAEFPAFTPEDVRALDDRLEAPPRGRDGLFAVMMDRLDDLAYDLAHHDFSDRRTVRCITEEREMQRTLAWRIKERANGAYVVTREDEVADGRRTDIRLSADGGGHKAVIEVKIADNGWSLADLERALRDQLVGRYLRHSTCKAGCLLLTCHGRKRFWVHPETRKRIGFSEVVAFLRDRARSIEQETSHGVRLAVFDLDLTAPPFTPAHRGRQSPEMFSSGGRPQSPCTSPGAPPESRLEE